MQSETADNIIWSYFTSQSSVDKDQRNDSLMSALSRIEFSAMASPIPLRVALERVSTLSELRKRVLVVVGRSRRLAVEDHHQELKELMEEHGHVGQEVRKTIGDVASSYVAAGRGAAVVVLQAAHAPLD